MIAATAAAGLVLAPAPATAGDVFTYGRSEVIAAKEKLFEEAQAKAVAAMEELAAARAKVSSTVKDSVAQVGFRMNDSARAPQMYLRFNWSMMRAARPGVGTSHASHSQFGWVPKRAKHIRVDKVTSLGPQAGLHGPGPTWIKACQPQADTRCRWCHSARIPNTQTCSRKKDCHVTVPTPALAGGVCASAVSDLRTQVTPAPTRTEIGPPAAGSVKSSGVPSAVSAPADLPSPGSAISAAASSLSNLVQSVTGQQ